MLQVFEDAPVGTTVLVVSATDSDVGVNAQITYTLSSEISNEAVAHREQEFLINPQTGAITTNKLLDRETMSGMCGQFIALFILFLASKRGFQRN